MEILDVILKPYPHDGYDNMVLFIGRDNDYSAFEFRERFSDEEVEQISQRGLTGNELRHIAQHFWCYSENELLYRESDIRYENLIPIAVSKKYLFKTIEGVGRIKSLMGNIYYDMWYKCCIIRVQVREDFEENPSKNFFGILRIIEESKAEIDAITTDCIKKFFPEAEIILDEDDFYRIHLPEYSDMSMLEEYADRHTKLANEVLDRVAELIKEKIKTSKYIKLNDEK